MRLQVTALQDGAFQDTASQDTAFQDTAFQVTAFETPPANVSQFEAQLLSLAFRWPFSLSPRGTRSALYH
jgi:hypothetical protein